MVDRIQLILKSKNLSPSQFADEIQVQRSSVSHILTGRNKPSLDFILKILTSYPEINSDWLMFGKGQMIKQAEREEKIIIEEKQKIESQLELKEKKPQEKIPVPSFPDVIEEKEVQSGEIEKIVVLYKNKTFREYSPK